MPLSCQAFVGSNGSAATEPTTSALACPADKLPTESGQVVGPDIPLVLLATGQTAVTLQPDTLLAALHEILGLGASISGGVPHVDDAGVVGQGASTCLSPLDFVEPCTHQRIRYWQAGIEEQPDWVCLPCSESSKSDTSNSSKTTLRQTEPQVGGTSFGCLVVLT